jgi:hypothetical protein
MGAEANGNHSSVTTCITGAILAVILYLLSPGLMIYLDTHSGSARFPLWMEKTMFVVYAPLRALMRFKPVGKVYEAYLSWCAAPSMSAPPPSP